MLISLDELNYKDYIDINYEVLKDDDLDKRIISLENATVIGKLIKNSNGDISLECNFKGTMYILDSISMKEVPYPFNLNIDETLEDLSENYINCYDFSKNILDLKQILWQNIVLEVPISFTICNDANMKGNGWELTQEEKKVEGVDPRLQKLEDLLKGDD